MPDLAVNYEASPTIGRFLGSNARFRALIGPFGSGKSSGCVMELLRRASEQKPGRDGKRRTRWGVIRNTYPQLRDTTRKTFEQWVPAELGTWHEQAFRFDMAFGDVRAEVLFRALDRPGDIKNLLSLELTGAWVNEGREVPKAIFDALEGRVGRYPARVDGGCTWAGVFTDSNPWAKPHWGYRLFSLHEVLGSDGKAFKLPREHWAHYELFEQPSGRSPEAENLENLEPGYYDRLLIGKDSDWVKSYVDGGYPDADEGSIWGPVLEALAARGGLEEFEHPVDGVFTSWDLGISDATAIWFWRIGANRTIDVIDYYEEHGQPLSHFVDVLASKGYEYAKHWIPHDARARTLLTGSTVQEGLIKEYGAAHVKVTPSVSLMDGIQAGRWLLEQPTRIHPRCSPGVEALRSYHRCWDDVAKVYDRTPEHDWSSHGADAWRYLAIVARATELLTRERVQPDPEAGSVLRSKGITRRIVIERPTLDQLLKDRDRERRRI
jgi:hypothetical protein